MNWIKKNWLVISINVIIIFIILFIAELFLYLKSDKKCPFFLLVKDIKSAPMSTRYENLYFEPCVVDDVGLYRYRCPVGTNFKNKPILLFGCSYAWGAGLQEQQTFYYKLANLIKRPVYNRANIGWSVQHMLYHLRRNDFYSQVPKPEYVVYVYIPHHIKRMYKYEYIYSHFLRTSSKNGKYYDYNYLKYNEHFGKLYEEKRFQYIPYSRLWNWKILPFIATIKENNAEKSFRLLEKHLLECRYEIDKHWGMDTKFIILNYRRRQDILTSINIQKLKQNRIDVIRTDDLTDIGLNYIKYQLNENDIHPNEKAWDLITPLFVKKVKKIYPDF